MEQDSQNSVEAGNNPSEAPNKNTTDSPVTTETTNVQEVVNAGEGQPSTERQDAEKLNLGEQPNIEQPLTEQAPVDNGTGEQPQKGSNKTKIVAISAIAILAIGAGVLTAILLGNPNDNEVDTDQYTSQDELSEQDKLIMSGNGLSDFDLAFIKLEDQGDNMIYSPLSIKYALAMLADGAAGESKEQITKIIGDYKPKAYLNSGNRSLANAMFIRNSYADRVKSTYTDTVKTKYNAEVMFDSFETPDNANKWVNDKTLGIIPQMFDKDTLNPDINYMLINALAIDMNWNNQLQCAFGSSIPCLSKFSYSVRYPHEDYYYYIATIDEDYEKGSFNGKEGVNVAKIGTSANRYDIVSELGEENIRKTVQEEYDKWIQDPNNDPTFDLEEYMSELKANYGRVDRSTDFYFNNTDNEVVFAKDLQEYDGATLQYVGIMPKNDGLSDYINSLTAEDATGLIDGLKDSASIDSYKEGVVTKISANIPFFKFNYKIDDLEEDLGEFGIKDVFSSEDADLSNMLVIDKDSEGNPSIDAALHKADIEFSNDGIRAAAATAVGGAGSAGSGRFDYKWEIPVEEIDLTFDKPFLFLIRDKASGEVWFAGTVYNPVYE